tara:strand:+ start:24025 stop:24348 length:324 start_codon:yes stop_codon:yes gene_type:complete
MKITIEPTESQTHIEHADCLHGKVSVEIPCDNLNIRDAMDQVVKVLQAWGYHRANIADYLDEEFAWEIGLRDSSDREFSCPIGPVGETGERGYEYEIEDETSECGGV